MREAARRQWRFIRRFNTALGGYLPRPASRLMLDELNLISGEWQGFASDYSSAGWANREKPEECARRCAAAAMIRMGLDPADLRPAPEKPKPPRRPRERKPEPNPASAARTGPGFFDLDE
jgi:hypothetical protein